MRRPADWFIGAALLTLLLAGHTVHFLFPPAEANFPGAERLAEVAALPLLAVIVYRRVHAPPIDSGVRRADLARAQAQTETARQEASADQQAVARLTADLEAARQREQAVANLESKLEAAAGEVEDHRRRESELAEQLECARADLETANAQAAALGGLRAELESARRRTEAAEEARRDSQEAARRVTDEADQMRAEAEHRRREAEILARQLNATATKIGELKTELCSAQQRRDEDDGVKAEIDAALQTALKRVKVQALSETDLRGKIESYRQQESELRQELEHSRAQSKEAARELEQARAQADRAGRERQAAQDAAARLAAEFDRARSENERSAAALGEARAELERRRRETEALAAQLHARTEELGVLRAQLERAQSQAGERDRLKAELETALQRARTLASLEADLRRQIESHERQGRQLRQELELAREELKKTNGRTDSASTGPTRQVWPPAEGGLPLPVEAAALASRSAFVARPRDDGHESAGVTTATTAAGTALHSLPHVNICPRLGLWEDADSRCAFPFPGNCCYRLASPVGIALDYQSKYCLTGEHVKCPVFSGRVKSPHVPIGSQGAGLAWHIRRWLTALAAQSA